MAHDNVFEILFHLFTAAFILLQRQQQHEQRQQDEEGDDDGDTHNNIERDTQKEVVMQRLISDKRLRVHRLYDKIKFTVTINRWVSKEVVVGTTR